MFQSKLSDDVKISLTFVIFSAVVLLVYYLQDKNHDIERFYIQNEKPKYLLLKYSKYVLYVALFYNIKYIIFTFLKTS